MKPGKGDGDLAASGRDCGGHLRDEAGAAGRHLLQPRRHQLRRQARRFGQQIRHSHIEMTLHGS